MATINLPPLAERMRPHTLDDYTGQEHLVGEGAVLRKAIENGTVPSLIFWGPPGVGKTTLAQLIANYLELPFFSLSAIQAGVKEVRAVFEQTETVGKSILFIDEIHRFNKAQQDALLSAVERGKIILMGATTENPSFEVISALLSRCQVYILKPLGDKELGDILQR
ncbi:MAG TPA: AAA family ATPase, partial [Bacteroidia bacterium]|nr:AAA family ATPase [Bacteroidia bacterium]